MGGLIKFLLRIPFGIVSTGCAALVAFVAYATLIGLGAASAIAATAAVLAAVIGLCIGIGLDAYFGITAGLARKACERHMASLEYQWTKLGKNDPTNLLLAYAQACYLNTQPSGYFVSGWKAAAKRLETVLWLIERVLPYVRSELQLLFSPRSLQDWLGAMGNLSAAYAKVSDAQPAWRKALGLRPSPAAVAEAYRGGRRLRVVPAVKAGELPDGALNALDAIEKAETEDLRRGQGA